MPRLSRVVFAGLPHHITQRGNRRDDVFFNDEDRLAYLEWLQLYCEKHAVDILAYCLMTNHIHLIAVPQAEDYRWSSAAGHCGLRDDALLADQMLKDQDVVAVDAWSDWLAVEEERRRLDMLRKHVEKGLPCGSDDFVERLGKLAGRILQPRPQGRPRVEKEEKG